jgi:hypothetical protein
MIWDGPIVELAWQVWCHDLAHKKIKSLPLIICWGIWLARNKAIFQDRPSLPDCIVAQGLSILSHFPQEKDSLVV